MPQLNRAWAVVRLVHPFPVSIVVATSGVFLVVASGEYPGTSVLVRGLGTVLACQVAVGALNDYVDRVPDAIFQPDKPIPSGLVTPQFALGLAVGSLVVTVALAATFGAASCAVMVIATGGGISYDIWLKPTPFSLAGYLVGFLGLFTWIWLVSEQMAGIFWLVYPAAACVVTAAHLANAAPDIETDALQGLASLTVLLGPRRTLHAIIVLYAAATLPALGLAVIAQSAGAAVLVAGSTVLTALAIVSARNFTASRAARVTFFRLFAPAVGAFGIGCLIALRQIG
jgi:4-hydroxybenzoate polyprenyltransferase